MAVLASVYILAAFLVVGSLQTEFQPCKNAPAPKDLRVEGCEKFPCPFVRGTTLKAQWDFLVTADTATLKPQARATVLGATINYPLPEKDACKHLANAECPLDKDEEVTYNLQMPILSVYPKVPLSVEFSLIDEHGNQQVCFSIDAKVV